MVGPGSCLRKQAACLRKRTPIVNTGSDERSRNLTEKEGLANLCQEFALAAFPVTATVAGQEAAVAQRRSNEAGTLLIAKHLPIYLGNSRRRSRLAQRASLSSEVG
jgi:hypothetical protein